MAYRILSLDGGGAWAVIQALALVEIYGEDKRGHDVLAEFDLTAANSGGTLVLGGLIESLPLGEIRDRFLREPERRSIFMPTSCWKRLRRKVLCFGPRYNTAAKRSGLVRLFPEAGSKRISDLPDHVRQQHGHRTDFLITAFDYDRNRAAFFRSNQPSHSASGAPPRNPSLVDAIHAATNAPVDYFDAPTEAEGRRYWDGAVGGYNNPALAAVVEALANKTPAEAIRVLSIGTGSVFLPLANGGADEPAALMQPREKPGLVHDTKLLAKSILADPPDAATYITHVALGQPLPAQRGDPVSCSHVVRLNPLIQPIWNAAKPGYEVPRGLDEERFRALVELDIDAVAQRDVELIVELAKAWIAGGIRNQPIRAGGEPEFRCEIGQSSFAEALACWRRVAELPAPP